MTLVLVETPPDRCYYLSEQQPPVFIGSCPRVVQDDRQVQVGVANNSLYILGKTKMKDSTFVKLYKKDPAEAVAKALGKKPRKKASPK